MKVNRNVIPVAFQPVSFTITIETEEENKILRDILARNVSIPEMMYTKGTPEYKAVVDVLNNLRRGIYDAE